MNSIEKNNRVIDEMYHAAENFHRVAHDIIPDDWLDNETDDGHWFVPSVVNMAFACELYLKVLLMKKQAPLTGHNLMELYTNLPDEMKNKIRDYPDFRGNEFIQRLDENKNLFVEWRYYFEENAHASVDVIFLEKLALALNEIVRMEMAAISDGV